MNKPSKVRIDGVTYDINTDYRKALKCDEIANDESIGDYERSLALIYTLFPLDVLPDIFGILGFADDAAVIGVLTTIAMKLLDNYHLKENQKMPNGKMATPLNN